MTLHGKIKANGEIIGGWDARRLTELKGRRKRHEYVWEVDLNDDANGVQSRFGGTLSHRYDQGAIVLAAAVLNAARAELVPPVEIEQRRRDFMADEPELYAYIYAIVAAKVLDSAGDTTSGAIDGHAAANRLWKLSTRARLAAEKARGEG